MPVEKSSPLFGHVTNITPIVAPSGQSQFDRIASVERHIGSIQPKGFLGLNGETTISLTIGRLQISFAV
jgi:riboflavin synthase alpha subunit